MNDLATAMPRPAATPPTGRSPQARLPWQPLLGAAGGLSAADALSLDGMATQRSFASGDWIFTHRTRAQSLVVLLEGAVSVGHRAGTAMAPERLLHGPCWLDAASAWLVHASHVLDARAIGAVLVAELPRVALQALLQQRPALAAPLMAVLAEDVRRLSLHAHELMHKDANGRLAAWLHRRLEPSPEGLGLLRLKERKRDIAAQLGMSAETLSRQMRELSRSGLIEVHGYEVRVLDGAGLQRLAQA